MFLASEPHWAPQSIDGVAGSEDDSHRLSPLQFGAPGWSEGGSGRGSIRLCAQRLRQRVPLPVGMEPAKVWPVVALFAGVVPVGPDVPCRDVCEHDGPVRAIIDVAVVVGVGPGQGDPVTMVDLRVVRGDGAVDPHRGARLRMAAANCWSVSSSAEPYRSGLSRRSGPKRVRDSLTGLE